MIKKKYFIDDVIIFSEISAWIIPTDRYKYSNR